jgi:hypothetical protein
MNEKTTEPSHNSKVSQPELIPSDPNLSEREAIAKRIRLQMNNQEVEIERSRIETERIKAEEAARRINRAPS